MTRHAFTIVELLVAFLLATIVLALIWSFFTPEQRRFRADQSRLAGLQGVLQLDEALAWDVERIALALPDAQPAFTIDVPVVIAQGRRLEFRIFAAEPGQLGVQASAVVYEYDPARGTVSRTADGRTRTFPGLIARDLQWSLVRLEQVDATGYSADLPLHAVKYVVTCFSEELAAMEDRNRKDHELVTLAGAVALPYRSERMFHPYWRSSAIELLEGAP